MERPYALHAEERVVHWFEEREWRKWQALQAWTIIAGLPCNIMAPMDVRSEIHEGRRQRPGILVGACVAAERPGETRQTMATGIGVSRTQAAETYSNVGLVRCY